MASDNGVDQYSLVSSYGANKKSLFFYFKIKGALEEEVKKLSFQSIHIFQPSSLIRQPDLLRPAEKKLIWVMNKLSRVGFLESQRPLAVETLAKKMVSEAVQNPKTIEVFQRKNIEDKLTNIRA